MITVKIQGGLGNQLFTYVCGYAVSSKNEDKLVLDVSNYSNDYSRRFMLNKFKVDSYKKKDYRYINNIFGRVLVRSILKLKYNFIKEEDCFRFQENIFEPKDKIYLYGYWQNEKYFQKYSSDIRRQFIPKKINSNMKAFKAKIRGINSVAVHVRRGDYTTNNWTLNSLYYYKAIQYIQSKIQDPYFYFFSDDIEWTKNEFGLHKNYEYVSFKDDDIDLDEFIAMSSCENAIIANSTFSWWAAWLNNNDKKIIIAPKIAQWSGDYYPADWLQIDAT